MSRQGLRLAARGWSAIARMRAWGTWRAFWIGIGKALNQNPWMRRSALLAFFLFVLLPGCASTDPMIPLTGTDLASIDYGPYPENYQDLVEKYLAEASKEPLKVRVSQPVKGYWLEPRSGNRLMASGYFADVWVKRPDGAGGNVGEQKIGVVIKNGVVLMQLSEQEMQMVHPAGKAE